MLLASEKYGRGVSEISALPLAILRPYKIVLIIEKFEIFKKKNISRNKKITGRLFVIDHTIRVNMTVYSNVYCPSNALKYIKTLNC